MMAQTTKIIVAVIGGFSLFALAYYSSIGIGELLSGRVFWVEQVMLKCVLILLSLLLIRFGLKLSWREAGFQRPISKLNRLQVYGTGAFLGATATVLIFVTPAQVD